MSRLSSAYRRSITAVVLSGVALSALVGVIADPGARPASAASVCVPSTFWVNGVDGTNVIRHFAEDGSVIGSVPVALQYGDIGFSVDGTQLWAMSYLTGTPYFDRIDTTTGAVLQHVPLTLPNSGAGIVDPIYTEELATNSLSGFRDPTLGDGFLFGSSSSSRIFFSPEGSLGTPVQWASWPSLPGHRLIAAGDFLTLADGSVLGLAIDFDDYGDGTFLVRFAADGSGATVVGNIPSTYGAARLGDDVVFVPGAVGTQPFTLAMSAIPTAAGTAAVAIAPLIVADPMGAWSGAASTEDANTCVPPTAAPDSSSGAQGQSQSVDPLANDTAGADALDPATLTLLDAGGNPVATVTVPGEGTYSIAGGHIVFQPEPDFAGTATPVRYRIADAGGQVAESTYSPTVRATAVLAETGVTATGSGALAALFLGAGGVLLALRVCARRSVLTRSSR